MGVLVLFNTDGGSDGRSGFKSTISNHGENISGIMSKTVSLEVSSFLIIFHFERTTRLLNNTVVNGFIGVQDSLKVGVLDGE